jgi:hypothetical protein
MNASLQEAKFNSTAENNGIPSPLIDWEKFPVSVCDRKFLESALGLLGQFPAKTLLEIVAILGISFIGAIFARASSEGPLACASGGIVAMVLLATFAFVVHFWERKKDDAEDRKESPDGTSQSGDG